jgi:transposase-like protein
MTPPSTDGCSLPRRPEDRRLTEGVCRVHFTRTAQTHVPKGAQGIVASAIRSIFEQPDEPSARAQLRRVVDGLEARFPKVAELLEGAEADLLAHLAFLSPTVARSARRTPRSGSTRRSADAPTSWASSPHG